MSTAEDPRDNESSSVVVEEHRQWKFAFDFVTNEEVVEVERPDGSTQTYRGEHAYKFWLRSQGLIPDAADMLWGNRLKGREEPASAPEAEVAPSVAFSHAHSSFHELLDAFDAFLKEYLAEGSVIPMVSLEDFQQGMTRRLEGYVQTLREHEEREDVPLLYATAGYLLSELNDVIHDTETPGA